MLCHNIIIHFDLKIRFSSRHDNKFLFEENYLKSFITDLKLNDWLSLDRKLKSIRTNASFYWRGVGCLVGPFLASLTGRSSKYEVNKEQCYIMNLPSEGNGRTWSLQNDALILFVSNVRFAEEFNLFVYKICYTRLLMFIY